MEEQALFYNFDPLTIPDESTQMIAYYFTQAIDRMIVASKLNIDMRKYELEVLLYFRHLTYYNAKLELLITAENQVKWYDFFGEGNKSNKGDHFIRKKVSQAYDKGHTILQGIIPYESNETFSLHFYSDRYYEEYSDEFFEVEYRNDRFEWGCSYKKLYSFKHYWIYIREFFDYVKNL